MRFIASLLLALAFLFSCVNGQTRTVPSSSLTTPVLLYNLGYGGIVSAPLTIGNSGGVFSIVPLSTGPSDADTHLLFSAVSCTSVTESHCVWETNTNTSLIAPLVSIALLYEAGNCHFDVFGGINSVVAGGTVVSGCNGYPEPNDAFSLIPANSDASTFQIQTWYGALCVAPKGTAAQPFTLKPCSLADSTQIWSVYTSS